MTETSVPTPRPRLTRSESDRVFGGVCGGLGAYFGIDPVIPRVLFGVGVFFAPWLLLVYVVLLLALPPHGPATHRSPTWLWWVAFVLLLLAVPIVASHSVQILPSGGDFVLFAALIVVAAGLVHRRRTSRFAPVVPAATVTAAAPGSATELATEAEPQVPQWWQAPPAPPRPRRPPSPLARATFGASLVVFGTAAVGHQPLRIAVALMLGTVGLGMLIGSFLGRGRSLIPLAALLAGALVVVHNGTVAEARPGSGTYFRPTSVLDVPDYRAPTGAVTLDLSALSDYDPGVPVSRNIDVGAGHVVVIMPVRGGPVVVTGFEFGVGVGRLVTWGNDERGIGRWSGGNGSSSAPHATLMLDVRVGVGVLEVRDAT